MMPISGGTRTLDQEAVELHRDDEVVELHWMKEPDLVMHTQTGVAVPALCGVWMEPDEALATSITSGRERRVRYVSCTQCDLLHDLRTDAMTA